MEERIYRTVFDSVMSHRLPPGTKLAELALCSVFDASRGSVRKVLQRLAHDHIVELRPNKGAVVASPTTEETRQIFEARRAVEAVITRLVVKHAADVDLADLRVRMQAEQHALDRFDQSSWSQLASTFHLRLAELSGNLVLGRYMNELASRCALIVALYEAPGNASCEHEEHEALVDAIERRDADEAVRLMEEHLLELERNIHLRRETPELNLARMLGLG